MNKIALDHSLQFIDSWLRYRHSQLDHPGYVVAIAHKGKIVLNEAYGLANMEKKVPMTSSHIFRIASHSKTFTATALMQLQEQGKLRIDDYAVDYLPWLKEHKDRRWLKVTLRQLMSHGAGVIRDGLHADYWQLEEPFPDAEVLQREILAADLVLENNTKLKYSNFGYSLLGLVIEAVTHQNYNDYVTEHIVAVLGLRNTGPEYEDVISEKLVTGYSRRDVDKKRLRIATVSTRAMSPATGFYATATDLCSYFSAHFVGSNKLISDESKKEMQRVQFHAFSPGEKSHSDYGLGMDIENFGKRRLIGHGGGFPGHITQSYADPKDELVVVVLTNFLDSPAAEIAKGIYSIFDYFKDNSPKPDDKPKHALAHLGGRYSHVWSTTDIIVTGDKVVAADSDSWQPLHEVEELEYVNDTTFKVGETDSFLSEGELVRFNIHEGKVLTINYNGTTMWPEEAWIEKQRSRTIIES